MKKRVIAALLLLTGCSSTSVQYSALRTPPSGHTPVSAENIEVFTTAPPPRKYVEIGTLKGMHDSIASDEDLFVAMKREAAARRCDGLVVTQRGSNVVVAACIVYDAP